MEKDSFEEYLKESGPDKASKGYAWSTAIGLQAVDGLKPSKYLIETAIQNIEGNVTMREARDLIDSYYQERPEHLADDERTEEADKVSLRIAELLSETAFSFSPNEYISIHRRLFQGIYQHAGKIRDYNAWYFRNALVRANYTNLQKGIHETTEYLEVFLKNLLLNEKHELPNRNLHISGHLGKQKVDIGSEKVDIQEEKVDIEKVVSRKTGDFTVRTVGHIRKLFETFGTDQAFGRSAVVEVLKLQNSSASKLLAKMVQAGILKPVSGQGKGKYRFMRE